MDTTPRYFIVGAFFIALVSLTVVFILWFSKIDLDQNRYIYEIGFSGSVSGLREYEDVKFRGVPIGKVYKIKVDRNNVDKVTVLITVRRPELIRENSYATIEAQGLTGYSYVQIRGSTQDSPLLRAYPGQKHPVIQSQESNIESLFATMPKIVDNLNHIMGQLNTLFDKKTVADLKQVSHNLQLISHDLSRGPQSLRTLIQQLQGSVTRVNMSMQAFERTSTTMTNVMEENRRALHSFIQQGLPQVSRLAQEGEKLGTNLNRISQKFEQSPLGFLTKRQNEGYQLP